jgi:hypothetical protein
MAKNIPFVPIRSVLKANSKAGKINYASAGFFNQKKSKSVLRKKVLAPGFVPTPQENLIFKGGKTIRNLTYTNFYLGGKSAWAGSDIKNIDTALEQAMNDQFLNNVMRQYFSNNTIGNVFKASAVLEGPIPATFSEGNVKALIANLFTNDKLKGFDLGNTVFCFLLPKGTILSTDKTPNDKKKASKKKSPIPVEQDSSLQGLGGYHGSVHVDTKTTIYYAIGVYSAKQPNGKDNGIVVFDKPWKNIVATFYHELCEARTDADVDDAIRTKNIKYCGWISKHGEECGDFPMREARPLTLIMQEVPLANGKGTVPVQFQYSNAVAGPEGPIKKLHKILG